MHFTAWFCYNKFNTWLRITSRKSVRNQLVSNEKIMYHRQRKFTLDQGKDTSTILKLRDNIWFGLLL